MQALAASKAGSLDRAAIMCLYFDTMRVVVVTGAADRPDDPRQHITGDTKARLRRLGGDSRESLLARACAKLVLGDCADVEDLHAQLRQANRLIAAAKPEQRRGTVHEFQCTDGHQLVYSGTAPVDRKLTQIQQNAMTFGDGEALLRRAERCGMRRSGTITSEQWDRELENIVRAPDREQAQRDVAAKYGANSFQELSNQASASAFTAASSTGLACDHCGNVAGAEPLKKCVRCGMAYYCGRDCQKAAWQAHKARCRAPEVWAQGDFTQLKDWRHSRNDNTWLVLGEDGKRGAGHYHILQYIQDANGVSSTVAPRRDQVRSVHSSELQRNVMWQRMLQSMPYMSSGAPQYAAQQMLAQCSASGLL